MKSRIPTVFPVLVIGLTSLAVSAADDAKPPPLKAPDYSKYTNVLKKVTGEIVKIDEKMLTIRVSNLEKQQGFGADRRRLAKTELAFAFIEESLVRTSFLPPKVSDKGVKTQYTANEIKVLKRPPGAPGYAATLEDLKVGTDVTLHLVRDKTIPAAKATQADLRVKYAIIQPENPFMGLQGSWYLDAIESGSQRSEYKKVKSMVLTIKDNQWALAFGKDIVRDNQFVMSFGLARDNVNRAIIIIDPTTDPRIIQLRNPNGRIIWSGRYKLDGETLTICRPLRLGGPPPTELKSTDNSILWEWRKSKDD
jgi:uncharacterized protein (TIGR03067 family)